MTFYRYPKSKTPYLSEEHWVNTNPLESIFAGVRLRTDATKRLRKRETTVYLVFKLVERLSRNWRALNGGATLMQPVLTGCTFKEGVLQRTLVAATKAS